MKRAIIATAVIAYIAIFTFACTIEVEDRRERSTLERLSPAEFNALDCPTRMDVLSAHMGYDVREYIRCAPSLALPTVHPNWPDRTQYRQAVVNCSNAVILRSPLPDYCTSGMLREAATEGDGAWAADLTAAANELDLRER